MVISVDDTYIRQMTLLKRTCTHHDKNLSKMKIEGTFLNIVKSTIATKHLPQPIARIISVGKTKSLSSMICYT